MRRTLVLYDERCRFCRAAVGLLLMIDRAGRLEPAGLRGQRARAALGAVELDAVRVVDPGGEVHAGGAAVTQALRDTGAAWIAAGLGAAPRLTERGYRLVATNRGRLSRLLPAAVVARADRAIAARTCVE